MPRVDKNLLIGFSILWVCLTGAFSINFFLTNKVKDSDKVKISNINYILELHKYASNILKINTELQLGSAAPQSLTQLQKTKREILTSLYILKKDNGTHTIEKPLEKLEIETDKILQLWDENYALGTNNSVNQTKLIKQNNSIRTLVDEIENHKLIENKKLNIQSSENLRKNQDNSLIILGIFTLISALGLISIFLYRRLVHDKDMSRQEVRDSMELLKGVFESSQSGIMVFKAIRNNETSIIDLEWLAVNKKACDLIRRDEKKLIGQRLLKVSPVHATNGLFDAYAKVIQTEVPIELEHEYQLSTGEVLWLYISVSPIADGVAITFTNVTASKHNALKIKESEANLQALINNTADEVWSVDRNYETISANDSFLKRNKPIETTEKWMRILDRALEGESFEQEILIPNKDGETRLINYHFRPVVNNLKEITGVAVFGQDITEKKSTEARIRYQGKILKTILRNIPMILYTIDKDGTLTAIEGKALTMYGMRPEDVVGLNMLDLYPNHTHEIHTALSGKPTHFLWMGPNDPPERFFDTYLFPDENLKGTITGVSLDITQLKISQLALEVAKRRAEEVSAFKTRFLANMSHEIRTPLSAILGFADILRKEDADNRHQEFLGHIENAGTTLFKLIGDILDLTKIEEGKMTIMNDRFALQEVISSMLQPYEYQANEKGISFTLKFKGDFPIYVLGDAGKLIQVLINLVGNAIKFTHTGGIEILIEAEGVSDDVLILLQVSVTDSGIGIPAHKQASVFNAFSQADDGINRKFGGSGLGLSIASEMVRILGGRLDLQSPSLHTLGGDGVGSKFTFSIPLTKDESQSIVQTSTFSYDSIRIEGDYRVLMVEDNPVNQRLGSLYLQETGCILSIANNGREAIDRVRNNEFDLIFMDVQMPVLDGLAATRAIREINNNIPIVGLSANVYKEDVEACIHAGMSDFLAKPYNREKLLAILSKYAPKNVNVIRQYKHQSEDDLAEISNVNLENMIKIFGNSKHQLSDIIKAIDSILIEFIDMTSAVNAQNWSQKSKAISTIAHKIKSNLELVGLHQEIPKILILEEAGDTPYQPDYLLALENLKDAFTRVRQQLKEHMQG